MTKLIALKTRSKGKSIFEHDLCVIKKLDLVNFKASLKVESETYYNKFYKVEITDFNDEDNLHVSCTCPAADWQDICKHGSAALFALSQKLANLGAEEAQMQAEAIPAGTQLLKMTNIEETVIKRHLNSEDWPKARQLAYANRAQITTDFNQAATATIIYKNEKFDIFIKKVGAKQFYSSCSCPEGAESMCLHRACVLLQLKNKNGERAFELMKDWTDYKNQLLSEYGFSLTDDLSGLFDFTMEGDKPVLKVLDPSITPIKDLNRFVKTELQISPQNKTINIGISGQGKNKTDLEKTQQNTAKYGIAYLFNFTRTTDLPYFSITPILGKLNASETALVSHVTTILNVSGNIEFKEMPKFSENDYQIIQLCKELSFTELYNYARTKLRVTPKVNVWYYTLSAPLKPEDMDSAQTTAFWQYVNQKVRALFQLLEDKITYSALHTNHLSINTIAPIEIKGTKATVCFSVSEKNGFIELSTFLKTDTATIPLQHAKSTANGIMLQINNALYLVDNHNQPEIFNSFVQKPVVKVKSSNFPTLLNNVILPLQNHFEVISQIPLNYSDVQIEPRAQLYLKESEEYLILQPIISYNDTQIEPNNGSDIILVQNGQLIRLVRNREYETELRDFIMHLHPSFAEQLPETEGLYFYIHYNDVMMDNWFLNCFEQVKNRQIEVFGFKQLSKFHFNLHKPKLTFNKVSSGIDWFDLQASVEFGDISVSLKDVQKAIIKKDNFIKLEDGSLGILPQEWLQKYAALFKLSDTKGKNNLHLSKVHFNIVDQLYDEIKEANVLKELAEKRNKLRNFDKIQNITIPRQIKAELRPYQKSGFNWLNFLNEFRWGGCLADDMGLGKTLQILTFLQHLKQQKQSGTSLVVVPTSLIFNWEAEIEKFCHSLTLLRYHGPDRHKTSIDSFKKYDIIITSYGTLASDIEKFIKFTFHYVILDESQSVKNPETKRYKAVRLLNSHNRLALTGTPIENNTFDLYAQLNFLNPGMLGSIEFFKEQYANPIDKHNDQERVAELKRIVYPFILRRTKELVAKDLPEKTETILYCEMGAEQRKVYEAFRDMYRFKILDRINESGMSKAGMFILEGLMKLRQICDSPALLKDAEDYGHESVKLKELMAHITERTGKHKILIFSQFLMMLALVRKQLKAHKIAYAYLDGSTSPAEREEEVRKFQTQPDCRVFLVSLKAGGMGLNLTAADYVFLIDPWWNPAVEQQAIDRTHRIGQTNHVFAYKMICKDTVEEKILSLQQKKKLLAADLISTDKGFIKNLSKSDVEFLFS